jgi:hypothetical protein
MITEEHFEALRKIREEAANLRLACIATESTGSLLHLAYDRDISQRTSPSEKALLGKLRSTQ